MGIEMLGELLFDTRVGRNYAPRPPHSLGFHFNQRRNESDSMFCGPRTVRLEKCDYHD